MSTPRTGELVTALAEGVGADLAEIVADLEAVRAKVEALGDSARAINGLGNDCAGWASHLATVIDAVQKEVHDVPAKLLGKRVAEVKVHHNPELAEKARAGRPAA